MFLHAWALGLGLAAAGLPVLIHFLTRPRPARRPWSAMKFVREIVQERRARHRLRDVLILTLRTLAILAIAAAIARPIFAGRAQTVVDENAQVVRIVLLDVSQSMGVASGGSTPFERARPLAARSLEYRSGLRANLILAGARPRATFESASTNFAALQVSLSAAGVLPERLKLPLAVNRAAEMFAAAAPGARRELVVISDFQRTNWGAADFSALPADTHIELEPVAAGAAPANLAVMRVGTTGRAESGQDAELAVEVGNFSATPQSVRIETQLSDAVVVAAGQCAPFSRTTLTAPFRPSREGWHIGESRLTGADDALAADNVRACAIEVRPPPAICLVTREPVDQVPSAGYFLERGLVPELPRTGSSMTRLARFDPATLNRERLAQSDVIIVHRPGRFTAELAQSLLALVRRGRGMLYVASDAADAGNLRQFAGAGSDVRLPVVFSAPANPRRGLVLTQVSRDRPPFSAFSDQVAPALGQLRFSGGLATRRAEDGLADDVRAAFQDQSALLVVTGVGAGKLAILNLDLAASDLPASPVFVPLLAELVLELTAGRGTPLDVSSGEPATRSIRLDLDSLDGVTIDSKLPDGETGTLSQDAGGAAWHADAAPLPGVYSIRRGERIVSAIVSGIHADECDLRTLTAEVLRTRLAGGRNVVVREAAHPGREAGDTAWIWLAAFCLMCLIGESVILGVFRT